jgi:hypothetical protein
MKYRIKTKILPDQNQYLKVNLEQDFDILDVLTLSIYGTDVYPNPCSDWGVIIGRVVDSNSFPMENVKIGYIIPLDDTDSNNVLISTIYNSIVNSDYPLLPKYKVNKNHYPVGGFPSEDEVMANSALEYVYKKYFKYVTSTNKNGDYVLVGVPLGSGDLLMNFDSTDAGSLSTTPAQQLATGQKNKSDFKSDQQVNLTPKTANGGQIVTGSTKGQTINVGNISGSGEGGGSTIIATGATLSNFGGGSSVKNQTGDNVSVIQKQTPNDNKSVNSSGTLISRGAQVQVKSFFGDNDICEIGINRYDYKLDYKYQPCNYIIGSFYSDYSVFDSIEPTYVINNMALATSKQNMGGKVSFLLDGYDVDNPDVSADVFLDGSFYAVIPCKWDRYNIDEEGNWYKTNDDFTSNPTGICTKTPYCLMIYTNNQVSVNLNDGKTYSRASAIGFNLNNSADLVEQIGLDGSTGLTTVTKYNIKYNAQYYPHSPFPNGFYNSLDPTYYPYPEQNAGTRYRNGAELNWDYENRRSNIYTIASQWTKYGYYSALNIENNGMSDLKYNDILLRSMYSPLPNLYSTKPLSGDIELVSFISTMGINSPKSKLGPNVLPLDDDGPYGWDPSFQKVGDLDTGLYPNGVIGRTGSANSGFDFVDYFNNNNIGSWGFGGTTNSYFKVNNGNAGTFKIKGRMDFKLWGKGTFARHKLSIMLYRNGVNIVLDEFSNPGGVGSQWIDWGVTFTIDQNYDLRDGDIVYFRIQTSFLFDRMSCRLDNVSIKFYKVPTGTVFPLIVGNMYLPTFEATKYDSSFYPIETLKDIFDTNDGGVNAPKLSEMDLMLYPITDEIFDIVEHSQKRNPYDNNVTNYYFFCNQFWKLRDFIYNEIN